MTASDCTIAFHIGAHKTATTHLQRSFMKASDALDAQGVRFYGPKDFRLPGRSISALFGLKEGKAAQRSPTVQLDLMRKGAQRLVFSEENYIGVLNGPRRLAVIRRYPDAGARITALSQALGRPIDVLIGVRRPTAFLNSAYCQQLLGGRVVPIARYKEINPLQSVNWQDLVARLRAAEGVNQLTVWRHEDYGVVFPQICDAMGGAGAGPLVQPIDRRVHEGLSGQAVAEILLRHRDEENEKLGFAMRKLLPIGPKRPAFEGFDATEHAQGDAAYAEQMGAIAAMPGVTFLQPAAG